MKGKKSQKVAGSAFNFHFEQICIIRKEILICNTKLIKMKKTDNKSIILKKVQTRQFLVLFLCMKLVFSEVIKLNQDKECLCVYMSLHLSI